MLRRWLAWSAGLVAAVAALAHAGEGDAMDQPTDPVARQLALSALTTEQFNLQTARMGTIAEANGRSTLYLGTLSSAVIAIAFVGQTSQLGDTFYLSALMLLTAASMVACINAIVGGVTMALAPELYEGDSPELPGWSSA